jgi:succinate dehydrogenase / fumarate reductase cytochrome b subunit
MMSRDTEATWVSRYYDSTLGKKAVLAVTGAVVFAFVFFHMLGNLQVFMGPDRLNAYGRLLRVEPAVLWTVRLVLLGCVAVHVIAAVQVTLRNWAARPEGYARRSWRATDYASRTMVWSGPILAAFIVYHLLHLTLGAVHPSFAADDVYHNVIAAFRVAPVTAAYLVAQAMLGLHLYHGLWSLLQTLGLSSPAWDPARRWLAVALSVIVAVGYCSVPVAVFVGFVR